MSTAPCVFASPQEAPADCTGEEAKRPQQTSAPLPTDYSLFSLEWADAYACMYNAMPTHPIASSLPNLWAWRNWMQLEVKFAQGLVWLRCIRNGVHHLGPVGPWQGVDWAALEPELRAIGTLHQVPEALAALWKEQLTCQIDVQENRDYWEYLYTTEDLANLSGNRYHMQRNHVNAYIREHGEPDVRPLGAEHAASMLALSTRWYEAHDITPTTQAELESVHRVCDQWHTLGVYGYGLYLDGQLVAFSVGYALDATTTAVMYEKAEPGLRGAFPVMARAFARAAVQHTPLLNRAEDMGNPGMRNAKMLYRPVDFQRMCTVHLDA